MEGIEERKVDWDGLYKVDCGLSIPDQIKLWQKEQVAKVLCNTTATPAETRKMLKAIDRQVLREQDSYRRLCAQLIAMKVARAEDPDDAQEPRSSALDQQPQEQE